jgi:hypothetical protein
MTKPEKGSDKNLLFYSVLDLVSKKVLRLIKIENIDKTLGMFEVKNEASLHQNDVEPIIIGVEQNTGYNEKLRSFSDKAKVKIINLDIGKYQSLDVLLDEISNQARILGLKALIINNKSNFPVFLQESKKKLDLPLIIFSGYCDEKTAKSIYNSFCIGPKYEFIAKAIIEDIERLKIQPLAVIVDSQYAPTAKILNYFKSDKVLSNVQILNSKADITENLNMISEEISKLKLTGVRSLVFLGLNPLSQSDKGPEGSFESVTDELPTYVISNAQMFDDSIGYPDFRFASPTFDGSIVPFWKHASITPPSSNHSRSVIGEFAIELVHKAFQETYRDDGRLNVEEAAKYLRNLKGFKSDMGTIEFDENRVAYLDSVFELNCYSKYRLTIPKLDEKLSVDEDSSRTFHPCVNKEVAKIVGNLRESAKENQKYFELDKKFKLIFLEESKENKEMMQNIPHWLGVNQYLFMDSFIRTFKPILHDHFEGERERPYKLLYTFSRIENYSNCNLELRIVDTRSGSIVTRKTFKIDTKPNFNGESFVESPIPQEVVDWTENEIKKLQ